MRAIGTPPEADLRQVANGDFSSLSMPILVAATTREQFDEFLWNEALICSEVRRFRDPRYHRQHPENKILLLLPGYDSDQSTAVAVEWWVNDQDRYTVQLNHPRPCIEKDMRRTRRAMYLIAAAVLTLCVWVIFR